MFADFKVAFRYFRKIKVMSLISIGGLAVGIIACLFIIHYAKLESGLDFFQGTDLNEHFNSSNYLEFETSKMESNSHQVFFNKNATPPAEQLSFQYLLIATITFVLVIVGVNLVRFNASRSVKIASEKGMRKTLGIFRRHLSWQFLTKSLIISFIGLLIAMMAVQYLLPFFNEISGWSLTIDKVLSSQSLSYLLLVIILAGIISGLYPTVLLSSFNFSTLQRSVCRISEQIVCLRKSLIVFQFSIALTMILGSIIVFEQLDYLTQKKQRLTQIQEITVPISHENVKECTIPSKMKKPLAEKSKVSMCIALPAKRLKINATKTSNLNDQMNLYHSLIMGEFFHTLKVLILSKCSNLPIPYFELYKLD